MRHPFKQTLVTTALTLCISMPAYAMDARSAALGGSSIANGAGVHGILENPSTLMRLTRNGQRIHLHLGSSIDMRDSGDLYNVLQDEEDLPDDIESEIDRLSGQIVSCAAEDIANNPDCISNLENLGSLATRVLGVFDRVDTKPVTGAIGFDLGVAATATRIPFAVHLKTGVTVFGQAIVADADRDYIGAFEEVLNDGVLSLNEVLENEEFTIDAANQTLTVAQPEDTLQSSFQGSAMVRTQFGLSLATSLEVAGFNLDVGVTPKFSSFRASSIEGNIRDDFDDTTDDFSQKFEDSEVQESSFTFDVGVSTSLDSMPLRLSAVARNMITESVRTKDNFLFETTPQLIVGGAFDINMLTISADMALNKAKVDNLETQIISVGVEFGKNWFGARAGISHDNAREDDNTALSLGFSLGPLHIGGRLTESSSAQAGAQLAFSF